jgi:hypothetical protein
VRSAEAERFVRDVWATFQREGIVGVLTLASEDAQWRPHSAHSRQFRSTAEYRERLEQSALGEERVEGQGFGLWSHAGGFALHDARSGKPNLTGAVTPASAT